MLMEGVKIRRLENGFTVKYHVSKELPTKPAAVDPIPSGFGGEIFVTDLEQLKSLLVMLVEKYSTPTKPEPKTEVA